MSDFETIWPEWHVEELLGQGSYGQVYRISREAMGHVSHAAAKRIEIPQDEAEVSALASMGMDNQSIRAYFENTAQNIINEIAVMESLKGARNVVFIEDYRLIEREDGIGWTIWIRMELLEDLVSYQLGHGAPSVSETVRIGIDISNALECCHERGIIHRDVKPENVFRSTFGEYKLGDFGIAKQIETATRGTFSRKGTSQYMAPEVARGERYDARADVYSLGMMLYRYLNDLRFPFTPPSPQPVTPRDMEESLRRRMAGDELPAPGGADEGLAEIVLKACEADPSRRYSSASELMGDLQKWKAGSYKTASRLEEERQRAEMEKRQRIEQEERLRDELEVQQQKGRQRGNPPDTAGDSIPEPLKKGIRNNQLATYVLGASMLLALVGISTLVPALTLVGPLSLAIVLLILLVRMENQTLLGVQVVLAATLAISFLMSNVPVFLVAAFGTLAIGVYVLLQLISRHEQ